MAHCWIYHENAWAVLPLDGEAAWTVTGQHGQPVQVRHDTRDSSAVLLRSQWLEEGETWILIAPPQSEVRINGERVWLGMHCLTDKDEMRVPGVGRLFFSTEQLARAVPFSGTAAQPFFCPRCKQALSVGCRANVDEKLNPVTIRNHLFTIATRTEEALGEEQGSFIDGPDIAKLSPGAKQTKGFRLPGLLPPLDTLARHFPAIISPAA